MVPLVCRHALGGILYVQGASRIPITGRCVTLACRGVSFIAGGALVSAGRGVHARPEAYTLGPVSRVS